jgi:hypothetical protein
MMNENISLLNQIHSNEFQEVRTVVKLKVDTFNNEFTHIPRKSIVHIEGKKNQVSLKLNIRFD